MTRTGPLYQIDATLPVIIVIAVSVVAAIAISAWLVREVARRAIDRATPEDVASVVLALGALLNPLRMFLPWSSPGQPAQPPTEPGGHTDAPLHNELSRSPTKGDDHEI